MIIAFIIFAHGKQSVMGIGTILGLLTLVCVCGEYQELELIIQLTDYFNFDHHFFLLDSTAPTERYIGTKMCTPQTVYVPERIGDDSGLDNITELCGKNAFMIVAPGSSKFEHNLNLLHGMKKIQRLQTDIKIGVFFTQHTPIEELQKLFKWCKEHLIMNVFASTYPRSEVTQGFCPECAINISTFNHFGTFDVINVTSSDSYAEFFPSLKPNFHQHQFRVNPLDLHDRSNFNAFVWRTAFQLMNASFVIIDINYKIAADAVENQIDIDTALWALDLQRKKVRIYPLEFKCHVVIVPKTLPYSDFSDYLRNATSENFFGYTLISIVAVILVLGVLRYIKRKKILFLRSMVDVLNLLINDNGYIEYRQLYRVEVFVIVPLTFVGFIVTNGILSNLQSFITRPVLQRQVNTLEEIYRSSSPIYVWAEPLKNTLVERFSNQTGYNDWHNKIIADDHFWSYLESYNKTTSYALELNRANYVINIQRSLDIQGYHKTPNKILGKIYTYTANDEFLFFERMDAT